MLELDHGVCLLTFVFTLIVTDIQHLFLVANWCVGVGTFLLKLKYPSLRLALLLSFSFFPPTAMDVVHVAEITRK